MADVHPIPIPPNEQALLRVRALWRWENEGGAISGRPLSQPELAFDPNVAPPLTQAELVQLHIRVIALENLVIALLAQASNPQLVLAREMADYIAPRPGFTPHPLTVGAANEMLSMLKRASPFCDPRAEGTA